MIKQLYYIDMIVIRVAIQVKPESRRQFIDHIQQEAREVRERPGCERFELFADLTDPNRFLLLEEWLDRPSFRAYRDSDYFVQNRDQLFPMAADRPDTAYYTAELLD
jgi:quinol monooxygenase YgiN